jgi:two-component system sensor histidine kinase KdpD
VNLQYVEERQAQVAAITGKAVGESVPESFLRTADEIELVDAPPGYPVNQLAGAGASPGEVARLERQLSELRELALLLAADVVEKQLQEYLEGHGMPQAWGAHERILVCLTPRSDAAAMLSSAQRNASRFHGALLACYVEQENAGPEDRRRIAAHLDYAREIGAEVHTLKGDDFAAEIVRFARVQRITQLFIGHSLNHRGSRFFRSPIERLIDEAEDFDVRIFPHGEAR